ncbi:MAG: hypothetical protein QM744_14910 [Mesorhizobium sp.]
MVRVSRNENIVSPARDALFVIETEIISLEALVAALRIFSEAQDFIEPIALSILANTGASSVENIRKALREGIQLAEKNKSA